MLSCHVKRNEKQRFYLDLAHLCEDQAKCLDKGRLKRQVRAYELNYSKWRNPVLLENWKKIKKGLI